MRIGTDILEFNEFPIFTNGDEKRFFQDNFSKHEIKHTILKKNPNIEFARLFSIKESLLKADNTLLNINFNKIQILSKQGEISFKSFSISSSITNKYCVSIVMSFNSN